MKMLRIKVLGVVFLGSMAVGTTSDIFAQGPAPEETKGVKAELIQALDLGEQIPAMKGYQLRMRLFTFEPGGVVKRHGHIDKPMMTYVLEGTFTEHPEGGLVKELKAGESSADGKETDHWLENRGTTPLLMLVADVVKKQ